MEVGLAHLFETVQSAHLEEIRQLSAGGATAPGDERQLDLGTREGLQTARGRLSSRSPDPRAVEVTAGVGGHEVPVRDRRRIE